MRRQLGAAEWYTWCWTRLLDRFRLNINSLPISTFQRVCLRPKLEAVCRSVELCGPETQAAWWSQARTIHDLWTFKGALWLLPGVGCVMHIQTHKHTVPAPGFASSCICLQCVCNLCRGRIVCLEMRCMNICIECLCVSCGRMALKKKRKKGHRCQYGTFPKWLVVNCCGLVFGKQPNKLTLPVGQWRSATQHSPGGPTHGTDGYRWQRRMHTDRINEIQITTLMSSCSPVRSTILSTLNHTHSHTPPPHKNTRLHSLQRMLGEGRGTNMTGKGGSPV